MGKTKKFLLLSAIMLLLLSLSLISISLRKDSQDSIELADGRSKMGTTHFHLAWETHLFINKKGELKYEVKNEASINNNSYLILEKLNVNDLTRSYLGLEIIKFEHKSKYVFNDGKIYLTDKTMSLKELKKYVNNRIKDAGGEIPITIFADKSLRHSKIKPILEILKNAGINNVRFGALSKSENLPIWIKARLTRK